MPRLSLYRPEKGNDYKFIDRQSSEMFQVGGTDVYLHKYIGTDDGTTVKDITQIQDLVFLENRDRKYDPSIYRLRGIYNVQDLDFNLSQFGLFIDNDTLYMTMHINDFIRTIGRKPISGDVIELPHIKDEFALNDFDVSLPRYFVISDVGRAAEGFSPTWYPHLYRLKLTKIVAGQQYKDIFDQKVVDPVTGEETDNTLRDILSTHARELQINDAILAEAEADAQQSGYETQHFYTLAVDDKGNALLETVDDTTAPPDASDTGFDVSRTAKRPQRTGYSGYLLGDGIPDNGADFGSGITFPNSPNEGDYYLRTDFLPNRLFRFDGIRWVKREDAVRMTMTNDDPTNPLSANRLTQKGSFINNKNRTGVNLLASDVYTTPTNITQLLTTVTYAAGMFASAVINDSTIPQITVTAGTGGKALLTFSVEIVSGKQVAWKLYSSSTDQRQSLSKALRPKADL
jgi:hypothetical protein